MSGATRALLAGLVDYAGLFPPAGLAMAEAVANHAAYRRSPERWMLGRFVVPAARLDEMAEAVAQLPEALRGPAPWGISVLLGAGAHADVRVALEVDARPEGLLAVRAFEGRAGSVARVAELRGLVPPRFEVYCELPLDADLPALVAAVGSVGARAKVRTGGVTAAEIPPAAALLAFLESCASRRVAFKATAGLHHPVRGPAPLTYAPGSACATMFGHVNLVLAAAALWGGRARAEAAALLEATDRRTLTLGRDVVSWGGSRFSREDLEAARRDFVVGIGSCSFSEPVAELLQLGADVDGAGAEDG